MKSLAKLVNSIAVSKQWREQMCCHMTWRPFPLKGQNLCLCTKGSHLRIQFYIYLSCCSIRKAWQHLTGLRPPGSVQTWRDPLGHLNGSTLQFIPMSECAGASRFSINLWMFICSLITSFDLVANQPLLIRKLFFGIGTLWQGISCLVATEVCPSINSLGNIGSSTFWQEQNGLRIK